MTRYVLRRVALFVPTAVAASLVVFALMRVLPGDAALAILADTPHTVEMREALREALGLNEPLHIQYSQWARSMLSREVGGRSLETGEPIGAILASQLSVTALLSVYAVGISLSLALPASILAALHRGRRIDRAIDGMSLAALSIPTVFAALLVLWLLLRLVKWSPPIIYVAPNEHLAEHMAMMIWPALLLSLAYTPHLMRVTRGRLIDVLESDYAAAARARGVGEAGVVIRHGVPNAAITLLTVIGLQFGLLISGAIVVEAVFGVPGIGRGIVHAALARDYPVVQSAATVLVLLVLTVNLAVDIACALVDPRVHYGRRTV